MGYANVCPDCNGNFDPGHTCPPRPIGQRVRDLEAENVRLQEQVTGLRELLATSECEWTIECARLQEQVAEAERVSSGLHVAVLMGSEEANGYKARDKLRGEALEKLIPYAAAFDPTEYGRFEEPTQDADLQIARDAIAITPEEALKRERR